MTSFREKKRKGRLVLHAGMQVAALYISSLPIDSDVDVIDVNVRVWTQSKPLGDLQGGGADREEEVPRILFMVDEIQPVRGAIVSVAEGEAYRVDHLEPRDDISIVAFVTRLKESDTIGLPVPESS